MADDGGKSDSLKNDFVTVEKQVRDLLAEKKFVQALKILNGVYKKFSEYAPYFTLRGDCHNLKGERSDAEQCYLQAIELNPADINIYMTLAYFYDGMGKPDKVEDVLRLGARQSGNPIYFLSVLEGFHIARRDIKKALDIVREIERDYKGKGEYYYKKGESSFVLGLFPDVVEFLRQSQDLHYIGKYHYSYLAVAFSRLDHFQEALDFFRKAIQNNPGDIKIYEEMENLLKFGIKTGDQVLLTGIARRKSQISGDPAAIVNLMYVDDQPDKHEEAIAAFLKIDSADLKIDYRHFCEFPKNVLLYKGDFKNQRFNPLDSLLKAYIKLKELGDEPVATLYEAWHAWFAGDAGKAGALFKILADNIENLPEQYRGNATQGFNLVNGETGGPQKPEESQLDTEVGIGRYGIRLTEQARCEKIAAKKGLDEIVDKMIQNLIHGSRKSMLLTGPTGVGKSEAIRQLACRLAGPDCPEALKRCQIIQTSTSNVLSGAKYIGMWEQRLEQLCNRCRWSKKVVIYFEDISYIFGAGITEGSPKNIGEYLLSRMEQNEVAVIGELDSHQAQALFWEHPNFERVLTEIKLEQPNDVKLTEIINDEIFRHSLRISPEALHEVIELPRTFMPYKAFPGKAIEIISQFIESRGADQPAEHEISVQDITRTFCKMTGEPEFIVNPATRLDMDQTRKYISERVLGQDEAVDAVISAVLTFKARLSDERKPIRSFLFVGPTGVGKTELAKVLADYLFGSREKMIKLNMSEYNDFSAVARLIGTPHGKQSAFLSQVHKYPFAVVLLDEVEKSHPDVLNLLLQLLDEGIIYDADGKPAYFQTTIVIMTSNIGSRHYTIKGIGFETEINTDGLRNSVIADVKDFFSPEIFNRFDEVICFTPLTREVLETIINREVGKVLERRGLVSLGIEVEIDPLVKDFIVKTGYDRKYGARHIKRAVERAVALPLASLISTVALSEGQLVRINMRNGRPVADLPMAPELYEQKIGQAPNLSSVVIIRDDDIAATLAAAENRINNLKAKLHYDDIIGEKSSLQARMTEVTFWDDPKSASHTLKRFSELNRMTERVHRWEHILANITPALANGDGRKSDKERIDARIHMMGLLKDLESAEMEILLEGKYDFADAFIIIKADQIAGEGAVWLDELAGVYTSWARRRGYHYKIFGEQPKDRHNSGFMLLHIGGMNTFGLLKNERGIHRKAIVKKVGKKWQRKNHDCSVIILADVQPLEGGHDDIQIDIKKVSPARKGWRMKSLSRTVSLHHNQPEYNLAFLSDNSIEADKSLLRDMFMSYVHYQTRRPGDCPEDNIWGSIVRTYEAGEIHRILDHESKMLISNVKDYLTGKIDTLLLERLG